MAFTVHITNFQSIEEATIEVDGFTVVSGKNNSGKTSLMRAVLGVFTNPAIGPYLRHGTDELAVEIRFDDGQWVRWSKTRKGKVTYLVNGIQLQNVGRTVPPEVLALGVWPIQAGTSKVWPQVAPQFTGQVFLLDLPGSALAEAISDVERVGKLNGALKGAQSDLRSSQSLLKVRRKDQKMTEEKLKGFEGLQTVGDTIEELAKQELAIKALAAELEALGDLKERWETSRVTVDRLAGVESLTVPSEQEATRPSKTRRALKALRGLEKRRQAALKAVERLSEAPLDSLPPKEIELDASQVKLDLAWARAAQLKRDHQAAFVSQWETVDVPEMLKPLATLVQQVKAAGRAAQDHSALGTRLSDTVEEIEGLTIDLDDFNQQLEAAEHEVHQILGILGDCPTCGQEVRA